MSGLNSISKPLLSTRSKSQNKHSVFVAAPPKQAGIPPFKKEHSKNPTNYECSSPGIENTNANIMSGGGSDKPPLRKDTKASQSQASDLSICGGAIEHSSQQQHGKYFEKRSSHNYNGQVSQNQSSQQPQQQLPGGGNNAHSQNAYLFNNEKRDPAGQKMIGNFTNHSKEQSASGPMLLQNNPLKNMSRNRSPAVQQRIQFNGASSNSSNPVKLVSRPSQKESDISFSKQAVSQNNNKPPGGLVERKLQEISAGPQQNGEDLKSAAIAGIVGTTGSTSTNIAASNNKKKSMILLQAAPSLSQQPNFKSEISIRRSDTSSNYEFKLGSNNNNNNNNHIKSQQIPSDVDEEFYENGSDDHFNSLKEDIDQLINQEQQQLDKKNGKLFTEGNKLPAIKRQQPHVFKQKETILYAQMRQNNQKNALELPQIIDNIKQNVNSCENLFQNRLKERVSGIPMLLNNNHNNLHNNNNNNNNIMNQNIGQQNQRVFAVDEDVTNSYDVEIERAANYRDDKQANSQNPTKPASFTEISRHPRLFQEREGRLSSLSEHRDESIIQTPQQKLTQKPQVVATSGSKRIINIRRREGPHSAHAGRQAVSQRRLDDQQVVESINSLKNGLPWKKQESKSEKQGEIGNNNNSAESKSNNNNEESRSETQSMNINQNTIPNFSMSNGGGENATGGVGSGTDQFERLVFEQSQDSELASTAEKRKLKKLEKLNTYLQSKIETIGPQQQNGEEPQHQVLSQKSVNHSTHLIHPLSAHPRLSLPDSIRSTKHDTSSGNCNVSLFNSKTSGKEVSSAILKERNVSHNQNQTSNGSSGVGPAIVSQFTVPAQLVRHQSLSNKPSVETTAATGALGAGNQKPLRKGDNPIPMSAKAREIQRALSIAQEDKGNNDVANEKPYQQIGAIEVFDQALIKHAETNESDSVSLQLDKEIMRLNQLSSKSKSAREEQLRIQEELVKYNLKVKIRRKKQVEVVIENEQEEGQ